MEISENMSLIDIISTTGGINAGAVLVGVFFFCDDLEEDVLVETNAMGLSVIRVTCPFPQDRYALRTLTISRDLHHFYMVKK